jgi:hypothetical protein
MKTTSICKGCHRLRPVNNARYCQGCNERLREAEKRRPALEVPLTAKPEPMPPVVTDKIKDLDTTLPGGLMYPGLMASRDDEGGTPFGFGG